MVIVLRSVFHEDSKYQMQNFLDECLYKLKMLEYDRIDDSEGIDVNKTNDFVCVLCNGCHDLMQKGMNFINVAIVFAKGKDYRIHFWYMSKDEVMNLLRNADLTQKKWNITKHRNLILQLKNGQRNYKVC